MIDHTVWLRLESNSARLALCANTSRERFVTRRAIWVHAVVGFGKRRHPGTSRLVLVLSLIHFAKVCMVREMLDLLFGQVASIVGLDGLTVVTHAVRAMSAHSGVARSLDFAIFLVQSVVKWQLLDCIPRVIHTRLGGQIRDGDGGGILSSDFLSI